MLSSSERYEPVLYRMCSLWLRVRLDIYKGPGGRSDMYPPPHSLYTKALEARSDMCPPPHMTCILLLI